VRGIGEGCVDGKRGEGWGWEGEWGRLRGGEGYFVFGVRERERGEVSGGGGGEGSS
jgi:hypothetical protein